MGSFANSVFTVLLGWFRGAVDWLWSAMSSQENGGFMQWLGENWLPLVIALCAVCMVIDFVVHMLRWRPYKVWASFFRRLFGKSAEEPSQPRRQVVRREWLYADGTARMEELEEPAEDEPPQSEASWYQPAPEPEPPAPVRGVHLSQQYVQQFARPESAPYQRPAQLNYQQELDKAAPVKGLEDYPQPKQPPQEPAPVQQPTDRTDRLHKRVTKININMQGLLGSDEDELELHYRPAPPAVDKKEAYNAPYYPPQWKRPANVGTSVIGEQESK